MEAALRSAYYFVTGNNPEADAFERIRGRDGWREAKFDIEGTPVNVAVASGLGNARKLIESIRAGKANYDIVEIMACPGGCSGGGGQPIKMGVEMAQTRAEGLYGIDKTSLLRFSHENPTIQKLYAEYLEHPLSHKSHELLHTDHTTWKMPNECSENCETCALNQQ